MELISLNCRQCGAPLSIPDDLKHVTCGHCGAQLAVVHKGGAFYTEKLQQLDQRTNEMEGQLDALQREQKILALDQEWAEEKQKYAESERKADPDTPNDATCIVIVVAFMTGFSLVLSIWIPLRFLVGSYFLWLAMFAVAGLAGLIRGNKVLSYQEAEQAYLRRRAQLSSPKKSGGER